MKGLGALEKVRKARFMFAIDNQQACDVIEKELKALEIIKNKEINITLLKESEEIEDYNCCCLLTSVELTQEEYDLLKEVLL